MMRHPSSLTVEAGNIEFARPVPHAGLQASSILTLLIALIPAAAFAEELSIAPASMARIGTVDQRFQSYNVEMVEVTGGRFWKPYGSDTSAGSNRYAYRAPIDLTNTRLRRLAAALAPAYVRVSGTWANATYFADSNVPPAAPPIGFNGVLTRQQWQGGGRFLSRGPGTDRDFIRGKPGDSRRDLRMDTAAGIAPSRLYRVDRRPYRGSGVHERAQRRHDRRYA
jgi:hypothetical protein